MGGTEPELDQGTCPYHHYPRPPEGLSVPPVTDREHRASLHTVHCGCPSSISPLLCLHSSSRAETSHDAEPWHLHTFLYSHALSPANSGPSNPGPQRATPTAHPECSMPSRQPPCAACCPPHHACGDSRCCCLWPKPDWQPQHPPPVEHSRASGGASTLSDLGLSSSPSQLECPGGPLRTGKEACSPLAAQVFPAASSACTNHNQGSGHPAGLHTGSSSTTSSSTTGCPDGSHAVPRRQRASTTGSKHRGLLAYFQGQSSIGGFQRLQQLPALAAFQDPGPQAPPAEP